MVDETGDGEVVGRWIWQPQHERAYVAERGRRRLATAERLVSPSRSATPAPGAASPRGGRWLGSRARHLPAAGADLVCCGVDDPRLGRGRRPTSRRRRAASRGTTHRARCLRRPRPAASRHCSTGRRRPARHARRQLELLDRPAALGTGSAVHPRSSARRGRVSDQTSSTFSAGHRQTCAPRPPGRAAARSPWSPWRTAPRPP